LLGRGASRTTNLELVDAYDTDATNLAESAGMRERMTRRRVDIAATPDQVEARASELGDPSFARLQNVGYRAVGKSFRTFAHSPAAMVAVAEGRGMRTDYTYRGPVWQVVGLARAADVRSY
jgi:hypothetical protein